MLGNTPVGWIKNESTIIAIVAGIVIAMLFYRWLDKLRRTLFLFDTLGIAVFTVSGMQLALNYDILPLPAILLGIASAVAGGIVRDTLCNEIPLVFRKEIYATACLAGALTYYLALQFGLDKLFATLLSCGATVSIRTLAVWRKIELPKVKA